MSKREFDEGNIAGTDINMDAYLEMEPIPQSPPSLSGPWLPKTDWSRDGIIASDD